MIPAFYQTCPVLVNKFIKIMIFLKIIFKLTILITKIK